jgi:hypothetical protein
VIVGADLDIESADGAGTRVTLRMAVEDGGA